jgi:hypothetical protein
VSNFRDLVESISPKWMQGELSAGWWGVLVGVVADTAAEGWSLVVRSAWLLDEESPDDTLPLHAEERRMPRYPLESAAQHRDRLYNAWDAYRFGGAHTAIESQFEKAGYPGVRVVYFADRDGPFGQPAPYWSQFWVYFPVGTHPVTSNGPTYGSFTWGAGTLYGPGGLTREFMQTIRGIVKKWKSSRWVCRGFIFAVPDSKWGQFDYGDGHSWGSTIELGALI